jgi:hypothetical protein
VYVSCHQRFNPNTLKKFQTGFQIFISTHLKYEKLLFRYTTLPLYLLALNDRILLLLLLIVFVVCIYFVFGNDVLAKNPSFQLTDIFLCVLVVLFGMQTTVFMGILSAEFGLFSSASSRVALGFKTLFFIVSWLLLAVYSIRLVKDALIDFIIKCCTKSMSDVQTTGQQ